MWLVRGILRRKIDLVPARWSDLKRQVQSQVWHSTGPLPTIELSPVGGRFPRGWISLSLDVEVQAADTAFGTIRADDGRGYPASTTIQVLRSIRGSHIVRLPKIVSGLQYQPIRGHGHFLLGHISAQEISWPEAVFRQMARYCQDEDLTLAKAARAALTHIRMHGLRALWTWIQQYTKGEHSDKHYGPWVAQRDALLAASRERLSRRAQALSYRPTFSILMPVYQTPERLLRKAVESVLAQIYDRWELCICDDNSSDRKLDALLAEYCRRDPRIRVTVRDSNGHIATATNDAMRIASGDFMCLMDHDDTMEPDALLEYATVLDQAPNTDVIYCDEDLITIDDVRYEPIVKPGWSPENLESYMYIGHLACYRMSIAREIGGFRPAFSGAQDYDFALRYTEHTKNIRHVPKILYHWRAAPGSIAVSMNQKKYVIDAARRALQERLVRGGSAGLVRERETKGWFETRRELVGQPSVSVIVWPGSRPPDGSHEAQVEACRKSLADGTHYPNVEITAIAHGGLNDAAERATGEYLVFLSDGVRVASETWLEELLRINQRQGVGLTGPKLLFADNTLRHGGIVFCAGLPRPVRTGYPRSDWGYWGSSAIPRNYLAVPPACLMVRRESFQAAGAFNPAMVPPWQHYDLCLRIVERGERAVYVPSAELYDLGQDPPWAEDERRAFRSRWRHLTDPDPFYGANLTMDPPTFDFDGRSPARI